MAKVNQKPTWIPINHEQIYLKTRGHSVDIHVYPTMQRLWDAGIQTFFSCQGGPDSISTHKGRREKNGRAMVVILEKDLKKTLKILADLNPKKGKWDNRYARDRCGVKFDPLPEAYAVQVRIKGE